MCSTMRLIFNLYSTFNALFNIQLRIQHSTIHFIFNSLFTHSIIYSTISTIYSTFNFNFFNSNCITATLGTRSFFSRVTITFARLWRPKTRERGYFLRLNQDRKPRMKSLWHPGYNVANFVIKFRVHNTRLSNSVLEGDRLMFSLPWILFQHQDWKFASPLVITGQTSSLFLEFLMGKYMDYGLLLRTERLKRY